MLRWLRQPVILLLIFSTTVARASSNSCDGVYSSNFYSAQDFPTSRFWVDHPEYQGDQDYYSQSASATANEISRLIQGGLSVTDAFEIARQWRDSGRFRGQSIFRSSGQGFRTALKGRYLEYSAVLSGRYTRSRLPSIGNFVHTYYRTLEGSVAPSSIYDLNAQPYVIHPLDSEPIFLDAKARLEMLLNPQNKMSEAEATRVFVEAMYAYYVATPYTRGSAAIGNVVFAGIYASYFGRPLRGLPDGIDLEAISRSEENQKSVFVEKIMAILNPKR